MLTPAQAPPDPGGAVLIPSSSGCGAHGCDGLRAETFSVLIPSSSGCGAHGGELQSPHPPDRLNPFFFRVRCSPPRPVAPGPAPRLNPFFFRVRCSPVSAVDKLERHNVLIPSSSGCGAHVWSDDQSFGQGGLNPFFFRVRCSRVIMARIKRIHVLIPSSSGCGAHRARGC